MPRATAHICLSGWRHCRGTPATSPTGCSRHRGHRIWHTRGCFLLLTGFSSCLLCNPLQNNHPQSEATQADKRGPCLRPSPGAEGCVHACVHGPACARPRVSTAEHLPPGREAARLPEGAIPQQTCAQSQPRACGFTPCCLPRCLPMGDSPALPKEQAASRAHSCCQGGSAELAAHPAAVPSEQRSDSWICHPQLPPTLLLGPPGWEGAAWPGLMGTGGTRGGRDWCQTHRDAGCWARSVLVPCRLWARVQDRVPVTERGRGQLSELSTQRAGGASPVPPPPRVKSTSPPRDRGCTAASLCCRLLSCLGSVCFTN